MLSKRWLCVAVFVLLTASAGIVTAQLSPEEELGKKLFFDIDLSTPPGESCAACHDPAVGYTGPDSNINNHGAVYEGAFDGRFGNRKPPSAAYAGGSLNLTHQAPFKGGMFWDGRATGWILGDPLAEQAQGPFLNPLEQNNPNANVVVGKVLGSSYKNLFKTVCGKKCDVNKYYECIGRSIAAYERSTEVSSFTSRYDDYVEGNCLKAKENVPIAMYHRCSLISHMTTWEYRRI
jgi:cytochrome c peroxidase